MIALGPIVTQCPDCNFSAPTITLAFLILTLATELLKFFALSLDFSLVGVRLALLIGLSVLLSLKLIAN